MSNATATKTVLTGDGTFAGIVTGGTYTFSEIGRAGLTNDNVPAAFDATTGILKPTCIVKSRTLVPTRDIHDEVTQESSFRATLELWFYDDGDADVSVIESAASRAYVLLHDKKVNNARAMWIYTTESEREPVLQNAIFLRLDFEFVGIRSS